MVEISHSLPVRQCHCLAGAAAIRPHSPSRSFDVHTGLATETSSHRRNDIRCTRVYASLLGGTTRCVKGAAFAVYATALIDGSTRRRACGGACGSGEFRI